MAIRLLLVVSIALVVAATADINSDIQAKMARLAKLEAQVRGEKEQAKQQEHEKEKAREKEEQIKREQKDRDAQVHKHDEKYISQAKHGNEHGDYQQYMDYQKHTSQGSGKDGGQSGDFSKYYQQYISQDSSKNGAGEYSKYMDYQKYMSQGSGKDGGQGGDYSKYYQKYMSQGSGKSGGGDYSKYMDYQKYISGDYQKYMQGHGKGGSSDYTPHVKNWSNREEVSDAFKHKYAGSYTLLNLNSMDDRSNSAGSKYSNEYMPQVKNWSDKEDVRDAFMKKYASNYRQYTSSDGTNLHAKEGGSDYASYYSSYVPQVKNISDAAEVSDAFKKRYAADHTSSAAARMLKKSADAANEDKLRDQEYGAPLMLSVTLERIAPLPLTVMLFGMLTFFVLARFVRGAFYRDRLKLQTALLSDPALV